MEAFWSRWPLLIVRRSWKTLASTSNTLKKMEVRFCNKRGVKNAHVRKLVPCLEVVAACYGSPIYNSAPNSPKLAEIFAASFKIFAQGIL